MPSLHILTPVLRGILTPWSRVALSCAVRADGLSSECSASTNDIESNEDSMQTLQSDWENG